MMLWNKIMVEVVVKFVVYLVVEWVVMLVSYLILFEGG